MCIYIHPCLFLRKQREVTGVVHIGVGFLRCSFSVVGIAKALNMERTKVRFPRLNLNEMVILLIINHNTDCAL